tara:strand:+ start:188 stop:958 length:771 start_codon:yes stop_codon:yes gene_type:complete
MKKYKYLVSNGCSYADGATLKDASHERYGYLIAKKLGIESKYGEDIEINISKQGGSNDRIFRTSFNWVQENKEKCKDTLMLIGLTELYREEHFSLHSNKYCKFQYANLESPDDLGMLQEQSKTDDLSELINHLKYRLINSIDSKHLTERLNRNIILFDTFAKYNNLDVVFFDSLRSDKEFDSFKNFTMPWDEEWKNNRLNFIKENNLNWFLFPNIVENWKQHMYEVDNTYMGNHPNKKQHQEFSELLWEYLSETFK